MPPLRKSERDSPPAEISRWKKPGGKTETHCIGPELDENQQGPSCLFAARELETGWQRDCFESLFFLVSACPSPRRRNSPKLGTELSSTAVQAFTESVPGVLLLLQAAEN
jgi:hypothetical protein